MWPSTPLFLLLLVLGAIQAAPRLVNFDEPNERTKRSTGRNWHLPLFGRQQTYYNQRDLDPIDGGLIGRSLDGIDGSLIGRSLDGIDGSLIGRSLDGIDGSLIGRSLDPIDGDLIGRSLDGIDGSLIGRSLDKIGSNHLIGRSLDGIDGSLIGRSLDGIDGSLIGRSLDKIGSNHLIGRSLDPIDGDLIGRSLDGIDGSLIGRSLDKIGSNHLIGRSLDPIDGDLIGRSLNNKNRAFVEIEAIVGRKPVRNFGVLQLGGGYGVAKRLSNQSKFDPKTEKHRRGPLNGLIPGGAFGRAARRSNSRTYEKLNTPIEENPYFPFQRDSKEDGHEKTSRNIDAYMPYQLMESI